jgi:hypothetical protein
MEQNVNKYSYEWYTSQDRGDPVNAAYIRCSDIAALYTEKTSGDRPFRIRVFLRGGQDFYIDCPNFVDFRKTCEGLLKTSLPEIG